MIDFTTPIPLEDAVQSLGAKTPLGSALRSAELERLPVEIRERAFFSATVENERILAEMQRRILQRVQLVREQLANGESVTMDRGRFIAEMQDELDRLGYRPDPEKAGGLQDVSSAGRLGLIWDMQLAQAQGYAKWKTGQDKDLLKAAPAQELIRVESRRERRLWPTIWAAAGGKFYGEPGPDYPGAPGRMIALKTDPIWTAISRFGTPWPPFDWGSGMGLRNVRRREALELGVIKRDDKAQQPLSTPLNSGLGASVKGLPDSSRERFRDAFGDAIRFDGDTISYERQPDPSDERSQETVRESLQRRAREIADDGRGRIVRARSEDDASAWPSGFETREFEDEILSSTAAVAVGRKQLYHDEWAGFAENIARLIREWLPDEVAVAVRDGHVYAWREDLLTAGLDELHELSAGYPPRNGKLLGYGQDFGVEPYAVVSLRRADGTPAYGFQAPAPAASTFAKARARDFIDATGEAIRIFIDGKEVTP